MDSTFVLNGDFGYVVLVMLASIFVLMWMGIEVGSARKKYEVPQNQAITAKLVQILNLAAGNAPIDAVYVTQGVTGLMLKIITGSLEVVRARQYPKMYSDNDHFNCVQRAHQNSLEGYPVYLIVQVFGGLYAPKIAAVAGVVYLAGRICYAKGYYTGNPDKRIWGEFAYFGLMALLGCSVIFALNLLRITDL